MKRALGLATQGLGKTTPNPAVGAVILNTDNQVVGEGYHAKAGEAHAEVRALQAAGAAAQGGTIYVTLEPCSHYGKTPPCADALIKAGLKKVVVATLDPNPLVAGKGIEKLKQAGIEVIVGVLEKEAQDLNEIFFHWIKMGLPFVALKYAMTLDGKIAASTGDSKWITGIEARTYTHYLRSIYDAILVGSGTVLADNPSLTVRLTEGKNPVRVILDTELKIPISSNVLTDSAAETLIVCSENVQTEKLELFRQINRLKIVQVPLQTDKLDLKVVLKKLAEYGLTSVLVEGGMTINGSFFDAGLVNRVYAFIAPKIIGGALAKTPIGGTGASLIEKGLVLEEIIKKHLGSDYLLTGRVER